MKAIIQALSAKDWNGTTLYSFKAGDNWYGCGSNKPEIAQGDLVEFEYKTGGNGRHNVERGTLSVLKTGATVVEAATAKAPFIAGARDEYWKAKEGRDIVTQRVIQLQASRNSAIALAEVILSNNGVKLPAEFSAHRMKAITALVHELTGIFEAESLACRGMASATQEEPTPELASEEIWSK